MAAFTAGDLVVYRVGDGTSNLANTGNAVFLDEYTTAGVLVQSIALPTTAAGNQHQLIASGTATSEGLLTLSADGQYLMLTGYGADLGGSTSLTGTAATSVPRVVGRVDLNGAIDTSTALTDAANQNNIRGADSTNGTDIWVTGAAGGIRYTTLGASTSTQLSTTVTNLRAVEIFDDPLYVSTSSGSAVRIGTVGTGEPTTSGQTITNLPGLPTGAPLASPYAFFLADLSQNVAGLDTLYVADDTTAGGEVLKYSLVGGNWVFNSALADTSVRGLTGAVDGTHVTLFTTTGGSTSTGGGSLDTFTDTGGYNAAITSDGLHHLASAVSKEAFRGIAFAPSDTTPPTLSSSTPADNATHVAAGADIVLTFSEAVKAGAGNITLTGGDGDVRTMAINDAQVTINGSTVTINPTADLHAGVAYDVTMPSGVISDTAGNAFPGIAQDALDFTVAAAPPANSITLSALDVAYTQNFDTLSNVAGSTTNNLTITGWSMTESGGGARDNEQYAVDAGASTTGDTYSYGAAGSTERALGELRSGTLIPIFGAFFFNDTGSTITSLDVAYTGEEWRLGTANRGPDSLNFEYSTDATSLTSGTWTGVASLNFTTPDTTTVGAKDGNSAAEHTALSSTITGLNIAPGTAFFIRWTDSDPSGADDGLAVDNFSLTPHNTPAAPTVSIANASITEGDSGTKVLNFTVTRSDTSTAFTVHFATADNGSASAGSDYVATFGDLTFTAGGSATQTVSVTINGDTTVEPNETFLVNLSNVVNQTGATTIAAGTATGTIVNDDAVITRIHDIQGNGHSSPIAGATVTTQGIVTAVDTNGFYIQDASPDADPNTSEGIFVFTSSAPPGSVVVGALVDVTGTVQEFTASGSDPGSLSVTELGNVSAITQLSTGNALPAPTVIGVGGLMPPTSGLGPGTDFFESLEGMRVTVLAPEVTGPTNQFGEIFTVASNGANATGVNGRGDILISGGASDFGHTDATGGDFNPERIQIDPGLGQSTPNVNVGAKLNDVTGIVSYSFGNYEVLATTPVTVATPSPLAKTGTTLSGDATHLLVGSYNAENFSVTGSGQAKLASIADEILHKLNAPGVIALQEIQDNSGPTDNGVTAADQNLQAIVNAINAASGGTITYGFIDNPFIGNDTNGGQPGGNIRTAFLYRTDQVQFVAGSLRTIAADGHAIADQGSAAADAAANSDQQTNANNPFFASRPPLAADFVFTATGQTITVVDNHFTSKLGSAVLMGSDQPPFDGGEVQRAAQAQAINNFVDSLLAANSNARVLVSGDLNDFGFEQPLSVLKGTASVTNYSANAADLIHATATYTPGGTQVLNDLQDTLPVDQRFDYVFEGNAETLDHMLASNRLAASAQFQPVHINSEFFDQTSDHDPLVGLFNMQPPPHLTASSPLDNATGVLIGDNIVLTFDEAVQAGTGNITLHPATGADIVIPVGSGQVSFNGSQVTINPTADLRPGVAYDVLIGSGVITDTIGNPFAGIVLDALDFTTSFTIPAGTFAQSFTITDPGVYTLLAGTTRTQTAGAAVLDTVPTGNTTIDIEGSLTGSPRGIDTGNTVFTGGNALTIVVGGAGKIIGPTNDGVRINNDMPGGTLTVDNAGVIVSGAVDGSGNISGVASGQGLDFNNVLTAQTTINNFAGALIGAADADAIRPGANATIRNFGAIKGQAGAGDSGNDGIDFQSNGGGSVSNFVTGTIEGARHGITGEQPITLSNDGSITGHLGSGVNMDTPSLSMTTVTNRGTIVGTGGFLNNDPNAPVDGDGVDVDGLLTLDNFGTIRATGVHVVNAGTGEVELQEAVTIGGGTIHNFAGGLIISFERAITVDDSGGGGGPNGSNGSNGGNAWAPTTIINQGKIEGDNGQAISITDTFADTLVNQGVIIGSVFLGGGNDVVEDHAGAIFSGTIDGGTGTDTINLLGDGIGKLANVANFELLSVQSGTWKIADTQSYAGGVTITGGVLDVDGSLGASAVAVMNGGTLGGHGSVGAVNVASGGILSPGASPGILTTGNLTLGGGAIFKVEINGTAAGTNCDQVHVNGTVDVTGATLSVASGFSPAPGATFKIIDNDGTDAVVGKFVGLAEGATVGNFTISYHGGDGNDVTLTSTTVNQAPPSAPPPAFTGTPGNDSFTAQPGSSSIDAGAGIDTITFNFKLVDATISFSGNQVTVDGPNGLSHTVLTGFEIYNFADGTVNNNDSNPLIDDLFYYSHYHDVWNAHADADQHYETIGWKEGRNPDAYFDTAGYLAHYADVKAAGINPLDHYDQFGWKEGRDPSVNFDTKHYLAAYPDVAAAHVDPLLHFLQNGLAEGRSSFADGVFG